MGLFEWLGSWFKPKPVVRDVSRMSDDSVDADVTQEVIDTSGGPLKPEHRRLALRDKRLLPKPKPKIDPYVWPRPPKPKIIPREEADRIFSHTFRTRDRNIRDLLADEAQLERYGLPVWQSEQDIADALEIPLKTLQHYSIHRHRETTCHYVVFSIPKRNGGERIIHAPKQRLRTILRKLNELLVRHLPMSDAAHGFRVGRSVATNASPHVGKQVVVRFDITDCFPSIHFGRVRGLLISLGYGYVVANSLAVLMTEPIRQIVEVSGERYYVPVGPRVCVQGFPTSPGICNAILMRLDRRLAGYASKHGFDYTRYADDLTLSGNNRSEVAALIAVTNKIAKDEGFELNRTKTRVIGNGRHQQVTGVTVNKEAGLSRKERRKLRAAIHQLDPSDAEKRRRLEGKVAYLKMLNPQQARRFEIALNTLNKPTD